MSLYILLSLVGSLTKHQISACSTHPSCKSCLLTITCPRSKELPGLDEALPEAISYTLPLRMGEGA